MVKSNCDLLLPVIDQLSEEIRGIDDQINALGAESLEELNLSRHFQLLRRVDHHVKEQHSLLNKWNEAMEELAICRSNQTGPSLIKGLRPSASG